ncbi:MAG: AzlD domain-containing protein [Candidatus Limivicinus sp.]|nr:AzlD domain-containing protein [Clostridiales bacterium]MCI7136895.1 AzlD domain-containing protein [Clostridiales bacterium]MDY6133489.1 AzlD domain-containing protein [Candidatus Limivicinus sp.]
MSHAALIIVVAGAVTLLLRFLPFLIFNGKRETPPYIIYLGKVLPYAIMGMLVIYCLRGISFTAAANFLPELIACAVVVLAHVWKRNTLLSIISGTVCYMLMVQFVF